MSENPEQIINSILTGNTVQVATNSSFQTLDDVIAVLGLLVVAVVYAVVYTVVSLLPFDAFVGAPNLVANEVLPEVQPVTASEGAPMVRCSGRKIRIPGTLIWVGDLKHFQETVEINEVETKVDRNKVDLAIAWGQAFGGTDGEGKLDDIRLVIFDGKVVWKKGKTSKFNFRWSSWTNHLGGSTQDPDDDLEDEVGAGAVSGFRNTAYSVVKDFRLEDFGGRIPITISAIVQPDSGNPTLGGTISDAWDRVPGADSSTEIDVSGVTGKNTIAIDGGNYVFEGYQKAGVIKVADILSELIPVFDLTARQSGDRLQFFDRGDEPVVEVDADHLGAAVGKASTSRPLEIQDLDLKKRPSEVQINFYSQKNRYQRATEGYKVNEPPNGENVVILNYSGVLTPAQARRVAKRRVIEAYRVGQHAFVRSLPPDYVTTEAGDVLAVPFGGQTYYVRAELVTIGADYTIEVEGVIEQVRAGDDEVLTTSSNDLGTQDDDADDGSDDPGVDDPEGPNDGGYSPPLMRVATMHLPALFVDKHAKDTGVYLAHCVEDSLVPFKGAKLYRSWKSSGGYKAVGVTIKEHTIGLALQVMQDSTGGFGQFLDRETQLRVMFFDGAPESATRSDVESGTNWVAIGNAESNRWEIAAFLDATPEAAVVTDLTGTDLEITDFETVTKTSGTSFSALGIVAGSYVRIVGFSEEENIDLFRRVLEVVDIHTLRLETDESGDLLAEGPLDSGTAASITTNDGVYILSNWFRGLRDSMHNVATHVAGDVVVLLSGISPYFRDLPKGKIGKNLRIKSPAKGHNLTDVLAQTTEFTGETMRPFRPCWFKAERVYQGGAEMDDYDIVLSFVHKTRFPFPDPTTTAVPPHDLDHEGKKDEYEIRIYDDEAKTNLVRSKNLVADDDHDSGESPVRREWTYTVAQQESDGTKNVELWVDIWQVGSVVKRGNVLEAYIPAI